MMRRSNVRSPSPVKRRQFAALLADRLYNLALFRRASIALFHRLFYGADRRYRPWLDAHWLGVQTLKCPLDLWVFQEILCDCQPDVIIESGTFRGGTALFLASICDLLQHGRLITLDIENRSDRPAHARITYLGGSSTDAATLEKVRGLIGADERVMVILDSDHHQAHVLEELHRYSPLVSVGQYLVVEDTNLNGHPVWPDFGPGPMEAVQVFLKGNGSFVADAAREKFLLTFNPGGYLRRVR